MGHAVMNSCYCEIRFHARLIILDPGEIVFPTVVTSWKSKVLHLENTDLVNQTNN